MIDVILKLTASIQITFLFIHLISFPCDIAHYFFLHHPVRVLTPRSSPPIPNQEVFLLLPGSIGSTPGFCIKLYYFVTYRRDHGQNRCIIFGIYVNRLISSLPSSGSTVQLCTNVHRSCKFSCFHSSCGYSHSTSTFYMFYMLTFCCTSLSSRTLNSFS